MQNGNDTLCQYCSSHSMYQTVPFPLFVPYQVHNALWDDIITGWRMK